MADLPTEPPTALTLDESARRYGAYAWAERRLFELTGAWAASEPTPAVRIHLDVVSGQHAWHAGLWWDRLPALASVEPEALVRPWGPVLPPAFDALAASSDTVERLAGLYRFVVPRLLVTYGDHLRRTAPVADAPAIRALRLVRRDETEEWEVGEGLLQSVLARTDDGLERAMSALFRLETAAPGEGLLAWPDGS